MDVGLITWGAILTAGLAWEAWTWWHHPEWTLSRFTQRIFHTTTPAGRAVFLTAWLGFAGWYAGHILGWV